MPSLTVSQQRFVRFLFAGGVNTLFGFVVYSALILAGAPVWVSLLFANIAGVLFNFATAGLFVFRSSLRGRLARFVACYLLVYLINLVAITIVGQWVTSKIYAQAVLTLPMALLSYFMMNRLVFVSARSD